MKFLRATPKKSGDSLFVFQLAKRERENLLFTLSCYSVVEMNLQSLSRTGEVDQEKQQLLTESMGDLRRARQKKLDAFVQGRHFKQMARGYQLLLSGEDLEWLLQVLNEIRVGCWINLGRPDTDNLDEREVKTGEWRSWMFMELCGIFQMCLLQAFGEKK